MSDRQPRYFDFIHQHEKRLNLIYSRWEAQIARQNAANQSGSLLGKIGRNKTAFAGMAIALGSALVAWQYGTYRTAALQNQRQAKATRNLIAANSYKLNKAAWELNHSAAYNSRLVCSQSGYSYEFSAGLFNNRPLVNKPRAFLSQPDTVSVIRTNLETQRPDAYLYLNPDRNLLYGSITETHNEIENKSYLIDLDRDFEDLPRSPEEIERYAQVQSDAIVLHQELSSSCSGDIGLMPQIPRFPYAD